MGGLFFDFEAVRTESRDRDAPRRLFEKWDLENGVINRRLKAEADEKDRYDAASVLPSSIDNGSRRWRVAAGASRGVRWRGGTHPSTLSLRIRSHRASRDVAACRGEGVAGDAPASTDARRSTPFVCHRRARERPRSFAKPPSTHQPRAGATARPTRSSPTTRSGPPRPTMRNCYDSSRSTTRRRP